MAKTVRNTTASPVIITDLGLTISASSTYTVPPQEYSLWAASVNLETLIQNNTLVVNDGYGDLDPTTGLKHIRQEGVPRDTSLLTTVELLTVANSTVSLTASSTLVYILSGTVSGQIIKLPSAQTITRGHRFQFWNKSNTVVSIRDFGNNILVTLNPNRRVELILESSATTNGVWTSDSSIFTGVADTQSRFCTSCGFDGNASTGRYLEFSSNVDSNQSGFLIPRNLLLKELSLTVQANSTITFGVYKFVSGVETLLTSISTTASRARYITDLNIALNAGEEVRVKCTSGSASRPVFFMFMVYT
jgi:hypothetical protein